MTGSIVLKDISAVSLGLRSDGNADVIQNAVISVKNGYIDFVGPSQSFAGNLSHGVSFPGCMALPGFVVSHNPICWIDNEHADASDPKSMREMQQLVSKATSSVEEHILESTILQRLKDQMTSGATTLELKLDMQIVSKLKFICSGYFAEFNLLYPH